MILSNEWSINFWFVLVEPEGLTNKWRNYEKREKIKLRTKQITSVCSVTILPCPPTQHTLTHTQQVQKPLTKLTFDSIVYSFSCSLFSLPSNMVEQESYHFEFLVIIWHSLFSLFLWCPSKHEFLFSLFNIWFDLIHFHLIFLSFLFLSFLNPLHYTLLHLYLFFKDSLQIYPTRQKIISKLISDTLISRIN